MTLAGGGALDRQASEELWNDGVCPQPFKRRLVQVMGGIGVLEMLFCTSLVALVGAGKLCDMRMVTMGLNG